MSYGKTSSKTKSKPAYELPDLATLPTASRRAQAINDYKSHVKSTSENTGAKSYNGPRSAPSGEGVQTGNLPDLSTLKTPAERNAAIASYKQQLRRPGSTNAKAAV